MDFLQQHRRWHGVPLMLVGLCVLCLVVAVLLYRPAFSSARLSACSAMLLGVVYAHPQRRAGSSGAAASS